MVAAEPVQLASFTHESVQSRGGTRLLDLERTSAGLELLRDAAALALRGGARLLDLEPRPSSPPSPAIHDAGTIRGGSRMLDLADDIPAPASLEGFSDWLSLEPELPADGSEAGRGSGVPSAWPSTDAERASGFRFRVAPLAPLLSLLPGKGTGTDGA